MNFLTEASLLVLAKSIYYVNEDLGQETLGKREE